MKHHVKMILTALEGFENVIPKRHPLPICECLKMDPRGFHGTDLDTTIFTPFPNLPKCLVDFREFKDKIKGFRGIVELQISEDESLLITGENRVTKVPTVSGDDYPDSPEFNPEYKFIMPGIWDYKAFVSTDELKPAMNGVFVSPSVGIAMTDAHRLIRIPVKDLNPGQPEILLPPSCFAFLKTSRVIEFDSNRAEIQLPNRTRVNVKLISDKYPDIEAVIPTNNPYGFRVHRETLIRELIEACKCANKTIFQIRFVFNCNNLRISTEDISYATEYGSQLVCQSLDVNPVVEMGFNGKFLTELLRSCQGETKEQIFELRRQGKSLRAIGIEVRYSHMKVKRILEECNNP